jgi:catechol 2,3-dioxygenase-like lactoylglutathione lyase family enzyme
LDSKQRVTIAAIHHVNIRAPARDIANLKQFYCQVVGLHEGWRPPFASRGYWLYAGEHAVLHLVECDDDGNAAVGRGVIDHVAFRCTDLESVIARLRGGGVEFSVTEVPVLGDVQLFFRDPLGVGIELTVAPRG